MIRKTFVPLILSMLTSLFAAPALAHKVVASAYPSGTVIEGQIGFSNGDMAKGARVEVFGPDGGKLGETATNDEGEFTFKPSQAVAHEFTSNLGAGHLATFTVSRADVEQVLGLQAGGDTTLPADASTPTPTSTATPNGEITLSMTDRLTLAEMVRNEVRPLVREIDAYKQHNGLQTILGGIGYILGLFGIGFYVAARRQARG